MRGIYSKGRFGKRGQIWVETVIYTLIGFAIIALVLAGAKPRIDNQRCEVAVEQAISAMVNLNSKVYDAQRATGNQRRIDIKVGTGVLAFDPDNDYITWTLECSFDYSEIDVPISLGSVNVTTTGAGPYDVELLLSYPVDIRFEGEESRVQEFNSAPVHYVFIIENQGVEDGEIVVDIREAS